MKTAELLGRHSAEASKDAKTPSHRLLVRGGYVRQVGQGIYMLLPSAQRIRARVEAILRDEMNRLGGQEVQMPIVVPAEFWKESGRYESVGDELLRVKDRTGHALVLSMTNEETAVDLVRASVESYRQLPVMIYQIQTKFRDEPRSRAGLIRTREFVMKDAYSFHRTMEDLAQYYERCRIAYQRFFRRCGLQKVVDIESSVGMMGGKVAHEFMLLSPHGEDSIFLCSSCRYRANREVVPVLRPYPADAKPAPLTPVETPSAKTIEQLASALGVQSAQTCKAVLLATETGSAVAAFVRGDLEVDQSKLRALVGASDVRPLRDDEMSALGLVPGFVGPLGLSNAKLLMCIDRSVAETPNLVIGANKPDWHTLNFNLTRDMPDAKLSDISQAIEGDPCPSCGAALRAERGIEVGNIFQLGVKYTEAMNFTYAEEDGTHRHPIMGCYGIGIGRTIACIVEENHDERGPFWPPNVAPFLIQICALQVKKPGVAEAANKLYAELAAAGVATLLDDRDVSAGIAFADADLYGAPIRAIISPRNLGQGIVELKYRLVSEADGLPASLSLEHAAQQLVELAKTMVDAADRVEGPNG
jgi:prolyl-tRNA synthetase